MNLMLRALRKEAHKTQEDLATELGVTKRVVGAWERQETQISLEDTCRVCDALGCTPNDLTGWYLEHPADRPAASLPRDESALLDNYRAAPPEGRATISAVAQMACGQEGCGSCEAGESARNAAIVSGDAAERADNTLSEVSA